MIKQMLIDTSHLEETRVVVLSDDRLEEFDYETTAKKQLKGNIYLAKVTRVEPALQAAFVDYGGNRHGFLPFSEIHPDYYRIPIADREALIAEEAAIARNGSDDDAEDSAAEPGAEADGANGSGKTAAAKAPRRRARRKAEGANGTDEGESGEVEEFEVETRVDTIGGDEAEEDARRRARLMRRYKIQEVIKRRQVLLVQVAKEERGNKGAALTTYLSLAGRYCVLMPNTNKGGGISRKIANAADRRRLKNVISELSIAEGMAVIVRTAGSQRSKAEIRRDYDYLLRLWDEIRENTLQSTAPALIYEEANLIKRAIRDLYSREMEGITVAGEEGYKAAKEFMKNLMPSHARKVRLYKDDSVPLFQSHGVERQLDAMHTATVQLRSGGYIVMNQTEALVAIDVNSGRATKERHIEETARRTNLEAAEEVARQLRLRDLAGLIVIDFIDMEESRHNRDVERRLKDAMRHDRARIQLGRISPFGLLELSRQRLRTSLFESSTVSCPHCAGLGRIRSTDSTALHILRVLEEEGVRRNSGNLIVTVPTAVALYILNQKRDRLFEIEQRYGFKLQVEQNDALTPPNYELRRIDEDGDVAQIVTSAAEEAAKEDGKRRRRRRSRRRDEEAAPEVAETGLAASVEDEAEGEEATEDQVQAGAEDDADAEDERKGRRRRGRRGGRRRTRKRREVAQGEDRVDAGAAGSGNGADEEEAEDQDRAPEDVDSAMASPTAPESDDSRAAESASDRPAKRARRPRSRQSRRPTKKAAAPTNGEKADIGLDADAAGQAESPCDADRPAAAADEEASATDKPAASRPRRRAPRSAKPKEIAADEAEVAHTEADEPAPSAPHLPLTPVADEQSYQPEPLTAQGEDKAEDGDEATDEDDDKPKRRGWWNRVF